MAEEGIIEIDYEELRELLNLPPPPKLPKYASQLINLANRYAQGTRPKVVGQMSELVKKFRSSGGSTYEEWERWYLDKMRDAIDEATEKIWNILQRIKEVLEKLEKRHVREWVRDLVLVKTYEGLLLQSAILQRVARELGGECRPATPEEESRGIDGVIILEDREIPVSIKPKSYLERERHLPEELEGRLIIYYKKKTGVVVDFSRLLE